MSGIAKVKRAGKLPEWGRPDTTGHGLSDYATPRFGKEGLEAAMKAMGVPEGSWALEAGPTEWEPGEERVPP